MRHNLQPTTRHGALARLAERPARALPWSRPHRFLPGASFQHRLRAAAHRPELQGTPWQSCAVKFCRRPLQQAVPAPGLPRAMFHTVIICRQGGPDAAYPPLAACRR